MSALSDATHLCSACGLCCNGVLFASVPVAESERGRLLADGFPVTPNDGSCEFPQPCSRLCGDLCDLYERRPDRCREFDCELLRATRLGQTNLPAARRLVRQTRSQVSAVERWLRLLGDDGEHLPLSRRCQRWLDMPPAGERSAEWLEDYAEFTLAVRELQRLLHNHFYSAARPTQTSSLSLRAKT